MLLFTSFHKKIKKIRSFGKLYRIFLLFNDWRRIHKIGWKLLLEYIVIMSIELALHKTHFMVRSTILIEYEFVGGRANAVFVDFVVIVTTLLSEYLCCVNIATGVRSIESLARKLMIEEQQSTLVENKSAIIL